MARFAIEFLIVVAAYDALDVARGREQLLGQMEETVGVSSEVIVYDDPHA